MTALRLLAGALAALVAIAAVSAAVGGLMFAALLALTT